MPTPEYRLFDCDHHFYETRDSFTRYIDPAYRDQAVHPIRQDDGTIGVYGHIDEALVSAGQRVAAGDLIATVGNRGQSTGPHLHYEVWQADGAKSDPTTWLAARGVSVGQTTNSAQ